MKDTLQNNSAFQLILCLGGRSRTEGFRGSILTQSSALAIKRLTFIWLLLGISSGCNRGGDFPTAEAGGVVKIDSRPLDNAHVIFTPGKGPAATGRTASDGSFTLSTYGTRDGAIVGHHHVTVVAREAGDGQYDRPGAPGIERPGKSLIPEKYGNTGTSGLAFDVDANGNNTFEIQLTSANH